MAKGYDKGRMQRTREPGLYQDENTRVAQKLGEVVSDLYMCTDERDLQRLWNSAHRLLLKTKADAERVKTVMAQRRVGALAKLASDLAMAPRLASSSGVPKEPQTVRGLVNHPPAASAAAPAPPAASPAPPVAAQPAAPSPDELRSAMKAFRKRLKLTRLDEESKLGRNPMSGGKRSTVVAIMPPREFRPAVWEQLVKEGKLRSSGGGFYELVE